MNKTLTALAAAAAMAVAAVAVPQQAQARFHGHFRHFGPGAFIGGLAAGAIIGGALGAPYYYVGGPYYYGGYYGPYAYGACWRERLWTPYGWRWRRVCR